MDEVVFSFERLDVYQVSRSFVMDVYKLVQHSLHKNALHYQAKYEELQYPLQQISLKGVVEIQ